MPRFGVLAAFVLLAACGSPRADVPIAGRMAVTDAQVAYGERVFMQQCNQCHPRGSAGLAPGINNKPIPPFLIRFQIRNGLGAMPAFPESQLGDKEVDAIIEYLMYMRERARNSSGRHRSRVKS